MSSKFEQYKKQYNELQKEKLKLYEKENEILKLMHEHCPHENTRIVDNDYVNLNFEEEPYRKCVDCGKVLK